MNVILATGIYPPEIGGPATYVYNVAEALTAKGIQVQVIAYGEARSPKPEARSPVWPVTLISRKGGPYFRWKRYAKELKKLAADADIVYCFSSVSVGVPLWMANLKNAHTVLRLGGDFLWERYTDRGGTMSLSEWYKSGSRFQGMMNGLLKQFHHIVFSTHFQEELYEKYYAHLPIHSVIENALPSGEPIYHTPHKKPKLLFLGRFVSFKNVGSLVMAMRQLPDATLTLVGEGPIECRLRSIAEAENLADRITFMPPVAGAEKRAVFDAHDLLVLPSYTEISPNTALEARSAGLPVLLTAETGLSSALTDSMVLSTLRSPRDIAHAVQDVLRGYEALADRSSMPLERRGWGQVAEDHIKLFRSML